MYFVHSLHQQILFSINNVIFSTVVWLYKAICLADAVDVDAVISQLITRNKLKGFIVLTYY